MFKKIIFTLLSLNFLTPSPIITIEPITTTFTVSYVYIYACYYLSKKVQKLAESKSLQVEILQFKESLKKPSPINKLDEEDPKNLLRKKLFRIASTISSIIFAAELIQPYVAPTKQERFEKGINRNLTIFKQSEKELMICLEKHTFADKTIVPDACHEMALKYYFSTIGKNYFKSLMEEKI